MDKERLIQNSNFSDFFDINWGLRKALHHQFISEKHCSGQNPLDCKVAGEVCVDGICRCGSLSSCEGRKTGALCDPILGECRCSENLISCTDPSRGNMCDSTNNSCNCSATSPACNGNEYCTLGYCTGNIFQKITET